MDYCERSRLRKNGPPRIALRRQAAVLAHSFLAIYFWPRQLTRKSGWSIWLVNLAGQSGRLAGEILVAIAAFTFRRTGDALIRCGWRAAGEIRSRTRLASQRRSRRTAAATRRNQRLHQHHSKQQRNHEDGFGLLAALRWRVGVVDFGFHIFMDARLATSLQHNRFVPMSALVRDHENFDTSTPVWQKNWKNG